MRPVAPLATLLKSVMNSPEYIADLEEELQKRIQKNPSYSMRSFAQSLQLSPSFLSHMLSGKRALSLEKAQ